MHTGLLIFLLFISTFAWASPSESLIPAIFRQPEVKDDDQYRIGDEWGKREVTKEMIGENPWLEQISFATAQVRFSATSFYLGKFNGEHVMGTNYHVCPSTYSCNWGRSKFAMLNRYFDNKEVIGSWPNIDFALYTIDVPTAEDEKLLQKYAKNLSFNAPIYKGQKLVTVGFGVAFNPHRTLMANYDSDCIVFSHEDEFYHMGDPDELNPGQYKAWSFANGCDVSHGDSGSAMVDRETGDLVGIIWTGRIPKAQRIKDSSYLDMLFETDSNEIWTELSYAVPASKIREHLLKQIDEGQITGWNASLVQAVIE